MPGVRNRVTSCTEVANLTSSVGSSPCPGTKVAVCAYPRSSLNSVVNKFTDPEVNRIVPTGRRSSKVPFTVKPPVRLKTQYRRTRYPNSPAKFSRKSFSPTSKEGEVGVAGEGETSVVGEAETSVAVEGEDVEGESEAEEEEAN